MDDINNTGEVGEDIEEEPEGEEINANYEEVNPTKIVRNPLNPSDEERRRHNVNHCPYRSWCNVCVLRAEVRKMPIIRILVKKCRLDCH